MTEEEIQKLNDSRKKNAYKTMHRCNPLSKGNTYEERDGLRVFVCAKDEKGKIMKTLYYLYPEPLYA